MHRKALFNSLVWGAGGLASMSTVNLMAVEHSYYGV